MRHFTWLLLASSALVSAQPTLTVRAPWRRGGEDCDKPIKDYFDAVGKKIARVRNREDNSSPPTCDLETVEMPVAPTPLPPPSEGLKLVHVALGRGTQNYTCADSTDQTKPVAVGAVANLYNATCAAADNDDLLRKLPDAVLQLDNPDPNNKKLPVAEFLRSGQHYFDGSGVPVFDMGTKRESYGVMFCSKVASSNAPADAPKGQHGEGFGSVGWLKLSAIAESVGFKELYRLNTAGGNPPPTCSGMPSQFEVQYATEYWLYN